MKKDVELLKIRYMQVTHNIKALSGRGTSLTATMDSVQMTEDTYETKRQENADICLTGAFLHSDMDSVACSKHGDQGKACQNDVIGLIRDLKRIL